MATHEGDNRTGVTISVRVRDEIDDAFDQIVFAEDICLKKGLCEVKVLFKFHTRWIFNA
jgi:hypothetical protein